MKVLHMNVIVDGESNYDVKGDPKDILSVVAAVSDFLREKDRAILSVCLDNEDVSPESVTERLEGVSLDSHTTLEITSEDIRTMVDKCLVELQENLPELPTACRSLAEVFHGENPEEGFTPFDELANIWSHIKKRELLVANAINMDFSDTELGDKTVGEAHVELNGFLEEAVQALQDGDCILLGDLLEYELAPRAELELEIVALLRTRAAARAG